MFKFVNFLKYYQQTQTSNGCVLNNNHNINGADVYFGSNVCFVNKIYAAAAAFHKSHRRKESMCSVISFPTNLVHFSEQKTQIFVFVFYLLGGGISNT